MLCTICYHCQNFKNLKNTQIFICMYLRYVFINVNNSLVIHHALNSVLIQKEHYSFSMEHDEVAPFSSAM